MTVIDFHTHAFPDSLAGRAIAKLEAEACGRWWAMLDGRVSSLLASMDAAGISRSVLCPICTKPEQFDGILRWCSSIRDERIIPLASVHPAAEDAVGQVRRVVDAGLLGLKLHPMHQDFYADEPAADAIYGAAEEAGLVVVLHCGCDIAFPGNLQAHPRRVAAIMDRHPNLTLVATHLGGYLAWDEVREHLVGRNVWMETSFTFGWTSQAQILAIIHDHGFERVLFGTDSPWADQTREVRWLNDLPIADREKAAILSGNATRLLERVQAAVSGG